MVNAPRHQAPSAGFGPDLLLVRSGRLGLRLPASGRVVGWRVPTSGRDVGWRVPTCGDYEPRIFCLPLVLFFAPHRHCSEVPDIFPMACDRRLATTGKGVVLRVPTSGRVVGWRVPTCGLPHTSSKSDSDRTPKLVLKRHWSTRNYPPLARV